MRYTLILILLAICAVQYFELRNIYLRGYKEGVKDKNAQCYLDIRKMIVQGYINND